ncbi:hypothetical protein DFJ77DRAFT_274626 [Powellomyces hirtus]|nr:hypothetical protein DFJ77DRAFT_274626 [Powellomyces hirtus]
MQTINRMGSLHLPIPPPLRLPQPAIPLPESHGLKRRRGDIETGDPVDAELFSEFVKGTRSREKALSSLNASELEAAREWAADRLEQALFIQQIEFPTFDEEYSYMLPPGFQKPEILYSTRLHPTITSMYSAEPCADISGCSVPKRVIECGGQAVRDIAQLTSQQITTVDQWKSLIHRVLRPLAFLLSGIPEVFPHESGEVWRTIISLNRNDATAAKLPLAKVKYPTSAHEDLLRDALILLPLCNRQLLQYLLSMSCAICDLAEAVHQPQLITLISSILGPLLFKTPQKTRTRPQTPRKLPQPVEQAPSWEALVWELLMYAGFRHTSCTSTSMVDCRIWRIPEELVDAIAGLNLSAKSTPRKKSLSRNGQTSPSRRSSLSRKLFGGGQRPSPIWGNSLGKHLPVGAYSSHPTQIWISVNSDGNTARGPRMVLLDREQWCKRRRLSR